MPKYSTLYIFYLITSIPLFCISSIFLFCISSIFKILTLSKDFFLELNTKQPFKSSLYTYPFLLITSYQVTVAHTPST